MSQSSESYDPGMLLDSPEAPQPLDLRKSLRIRDGLELLEDELRQMVSGLERAISMETKRVEEYERHVIELENELARDRRDLELLDDQLDDFLDN